MRLDSTVLSVWTVPIRDTVATGFPEIQNLPPSFTLYQNFPTEVLGVPRIPKTTLIEMTFETPGGDRPEQ